MERLKRLGKNYANILSHIFLNSIFNFPGNFLCEKGNHWSTVFQNYRWTFVNNEKSSECTSEEIKKNVIT